LTNIKKQDQWRS